MTLTLGDIFTLNNDYKVGNVTYTVEEIVDNGSATASTWENTTVTFTEKGTYTVTIEDDLFSDGTYTAEVKITEKGVRKFKATLPYAGFMSNAYDGSTKVQKTLGDIFFDTGLGTIDSSKVTVTATTTSGSTVTTITSNTSNWEGTLLTFEGVGEVTVTITDNTKCLTSTAKIGIAPLWPGDIDGSSSKTNAGYYGAITDYFNGVYRTYPDLTVKKGASTTVTLADSLPYEGVYGIAININGTNNNVRVTTSDNQYYADFVYSSTGWSDNDSGYVSEDQLIYLEEDSNTLTITNNGESDIKIVQINVGRLDAFGVEKSRDFLPLVQCVSYADPDGDTTGEPTLTHPATTTPDALGWVYSSRKQPGHWNSYVAGLSYTPQNQIIEAGEEKTYTVNNVFTYDGVYSMQMIVSSSNLPAIFKVTTDEGYYTYFILNSKDVWTNSGSMIPLMDQMLYFSAGAHTITIENIGTTSATVSGIDFGMMNGNSRNSKDFMSAVKGQSLSGGGTTPTPTPTPTPGGSEPTAPQKISFYELENYVGDFTNGSAYSGGMVYFGTTGNSTASITVGVPASGYYNINVMYGNWSDGTATIYSDLELTTETGDTITYPRTGTGRYNFTPAPTTVYLVKGDRKLTFTSIGANNTRIAIGGVELVPVD